jgi:hypothetical protein
MNYSGRKEREKGQIVLQLLTFRCECATSEMDMAKKILNASLLLSCWGTMTQISFESRELLCAFQSLFGVVG